LKLEVWDSPNSAGVVIDAIRCSKLALDRGVSGPLVGPSSYFMKAPPRQFTDQQARALTEAFIRGESAISTPVNGGEPAVSDERPVCRTKARIAQRAARRNGSRAASVKLK
jgi:hypothetical protein